MVVSGARLEDLRDQPLVGEMAYQIGPDATIRPLLFPHFAHTAYYLTLDALRNFVISDAIGSGPFVVPAIAFWFMAVESYISTIYKTCHILAESAGTAKWQAPCGQPLRQTGQVVEKMVAIKKWVAGDCPPEPPRNRLQEFATFRNALFHDLTAHAPTTQYAHTHFAAHAEKSNQADLMEAMNVSLEVFDYFRSLFYRADLVPSIQLGATTEKIDVLASEVIYPAFAEILKAKQLTCSVAGFRGHETCPAELRWEVKLIICADGPTAPLTIPSSESVSIVDKYQEAAVHARPISDTKFRIPRYTR